MSQVRSIPDAKIILRISSAGGSFNDSHLIYDCFSVLLIKEKLSQTFNGHNMMSDTTMSYQWGKRDIVLQTTIIIIIISFNR